MISFSESIVVCEDAAIVCESPLNERKLTAKNMNNIVLQIFIIKLSAIEL